MLCEKLTLRLKSVLIGQIIQLKLLAFGAHVLEVTFLDLNGVLGACWWWFQVPFLGSLCSVAGLVAETVGSVAIVLGLLAENLDITIVSTLGSSWAALTSDQPDDGEKNDLKNSTVQVRT